MLHSCTFSTVDVHYSLTFAFSLYLQFFLDAAFYWF